MADNPYDRNPPSLGPIRPEPPRRHGHAPPPMPPRHPDPAGADFRGPRTIYRRPEPPEQRSRWPRLALYTLLLLVALPVAGLGLLLLAPPTGMIRDRLVAEVKARTGRELIIGGDARLTLLPALGISLKNVSLSAPPAMPGPPLLTADGLEVQVGLLGLLTREVSIERLVLRRPVIELRVDAAGKRSWDFAEAMDARPNGALRYAQVNPRGADGMAIPRELQDFVKNATDGKAGGGKTGGKLGGLGGLSLADVRIHDGTLRYADQRKGQSHELNGIDARIALKEIAGPLDLNGHLVLNGERVAVDARVHAFRDLIEERATKVTVKLGARPLEASYDGLVTPGAAAALDGRLVLKSTSLDALARLLQVPIAGADALGAFAIDGQIKLAGGAFGISGASFDLGETSAKGAIAVETAGARPLIKANLRIAVLDLNRLAGLEAAPAPVAPASATAPPASPAGRFSPPAGAPLGPARSIDDLLSRPETEAPAKPAVPTVRGFTRRDGWSSEPIDLTLLRLVDLDGRFEIGRIAWAKLKIGATQTAIQLKGGLLKVELAEAQLYGGRVKGLASLDAREAEASFGANVSGDGLAALGLMSDAADLDVIDGRARLNIAVSAKGGSERELIGTLAGKADLFMADGAIIGWDASQMIAGLGQGRIPSPERTAGARTPFTELAGSFQIEHGVARNQDLRLKGPALTAAGSGVINLVDRNLNLVVRPKPAAMPGGIGGIEIPLRIAGPFDRITVRPDAGGALRSEQTQETIKQLGRQLQDGNVDGALRGVLGNDPKADEKIGKAKERLRQFLNR